MSDDRVVEPARWENPMGYAYRARIEDTGSRRRPFRAVIDRSFFSHRCDWKPYRRLRRDRSYLEAENRANAWLDAHEWRPMPGEIVTERGDQ